MATIAPWLVPPNYLQAIEAGASTGLALRRQSESEAEAGDRLRLAYDQLAAQERRSAEETRSKMALAHASLALRSQQMSSLDAYRQGTLAARSETDRIREENMARLGQQFAEREKRLGSQFETRMDEARAREERLASQFGERRKFLDPVTHALLQADVADLRSTQKEREKLGPPSSGFFGLKSNKARIAELKKKEADLLEKIKGYGATPATPAEAAAAVGKRFRWDTKANDYVPIGE